MKTNILVALLVMFCLPIGAVLAADELAPIAEFEKAFEAFVEPGERDVPDASEVGIPAYPGSQFCTIKKGSFGEGGWTEVHLLSTDPYEKVAAWFREELDGWYCSELSAGTSLRCSDKDPGAWGVYDPETFNVVDVSKTDIAMPCVLEGMQTGISISYQPD